MKKQIRKSLVIGLDCSTTGTKAIAVNNIGGIAAATYCCNFAKKTTTERLFSQVIDDRLEILERALLRGCVKTNVAHLLPFYN